MQSEKKEKKTYLSVKILEIGALRL